MSAPARIFFFSGTHTVRSLKELQRWVLLFKKKYGLSTAFSVEADEVPSKEVFHLIEQALQANTLFPEPTLLVIKRFLVTNSPKGNEAVGKEFIQSIEKISHIFDAQQTVLIWEPEEISSTHPVRQWLDKAAEENKVKIYDFTLPTDSRVAGFISKQLEERGIELEPATKNWLTNEYRNLGLALRVQQKLKTGVALQRDTRGWWLEQMVYSLSLLPAENRAETTSLQQLLTHASESVGVFEIVSCVQLHQWEKAHALLLKLGEQASDSDYYALLAALRYGLKRLPPREALFYQRLLMELELLIKNFSIPLAWVFSLFLIRSAQGEKAESTELISGKSAWLAHLARS